MAKEYECEVCGKEFSSKRGLHIHQGQKHPDIAEKEEKEEPEEVEEPTEVEEPEREIKEEGTEYEPPKKWPAFILLVISALAIGVVLGLSVNGTPKTVDVQAPKSPETYEPAHSTQEVKELAEKTMLAMEVPATAEKPEFERGMWIVNTTAQSPTGKKATIQVRINDSTMKPEKIYFLLPVPENIEGVQATPEETVNATETPENTTEANATENAGNTTEANSTE